MSAQQHDRGDRATCNRENVQCIAENMDVECGIKVVAGGPALGVIILAKVGGENELFRGSMQRVEEKEKATVLRQEERRKVGSIRNPYPHSNPNCP